MLHDILVSAKDSVRKTHLMSAASLGYSRGMQLLEIAERAGFIEETEGVKSQRHWRSKPNMVWKTTDAGLAWAQRVWKDYQLVSNSDPNK